MCVSLARTQRTRTHTLKRIEQLVDHAAAVPGGGGTPRQVVSKLMRACVFNPEKPPKCFQNNESKQNFSVNDIYEALGRSSCTGLPHCDLIL